MKNSALATILFAGLLALVLNFWGIEQPYRAIEQGAFWLLVIVSAVGGLMETKTVVNRQALKLLNSAAADLRHAASLSAGQATAAVGLRDMEAHEIDSDGFAITATRIESFVKAQSS